MALATPQALGGGPATLKGKKKKKTKNGLGAFEGGRTTAKAQNPFTCLRNTCHFYILSLLKIPPTNLIWRKTLFN